MAQSTRAREMASKDMRKAWLREGIHGATDFGDNGVQRGRGCMAWGWDEQRAAMAENESEGGYATFDAR